MPEEINLQFLVINKPLPDFIYEGLKNYSSGANAYRPQPQELKEILAKRHGMGVENIFLTDGADEGIQIFINAFGKNVYAYTPTYIVIRDTRMWGGNLNEIYSIKDGRFEISTDRYNDATLIYLANPNNPSGFTPREKVLDLIKNNPESMVLVDEAYGDFAPELSVLAETKNYKNLAVLRSFSKGYGMAGNRIGYVVTNPENIEKVRGFAQWSNTSYLSVGAAITALKHEEYFKDIITVLHSVRDDFMSFLKSEGFTFLPSRINAVLIQFKNEEEGTGFYEYLKNNNIIGSLGNSHSNIGLDNSFVRLAVGTSDQMNYVKESIQNYKRGEKR